MAASTSSRSGLFSLFKPYQAWLMLLMALTVLTNGLNLLLPRLIERGIDDYATRPEHLGEILWPFAAVSVAILVFTLIQNLVQALTAEWVARDLRGQLVEKLSQQPYPTLQELGAATLLTRLTSDVDAIKLFVSQVLVAMVSSLLLIVGASGLLLWMHWQLALGVLLTLPLIAFGFRLIFGPARELFGRSQGVVDQLNRVINESILGAALVRVLHSAAAEQHKFQQPNTEARTIGFRILAMFASLIPMINFAGGLGSLIILLLGGHFVMVGSLTLGELAAFNAYLMMLIFPILVMGFTSQQMARASASYARLLPILQLPVALQAPVMTEPVTAVEVTELSLQWGGKPVLKNVSFGLAAGSRTAILGPTAAGKTLLVQILAGLLVPDQGQVAYNGVPQVAGQTQLPPGIALVFQDSVIFQLSLRENIAFGPQAQAEDIHKALRVAELESFVASLPQGLDTLVSERGMSLSGGQKQRLMLARALAQNPSLLILDDFTARVDTATEQRIVANLRREYPHLTLLSVTQKIEAVQDFDAILLLMEGELLASGTHASLMQTSPEYMQIYQSQRSTEPYGG
jgi:ATP-binding cassette subfamily B protein